MTVERGRTDEAGARFGVHTFGEVPAPDGSVGQLPGTLSHVVEQAVLAEQVGLDFFGVGEHHGSDFAISQPEMVLAAVAMKTRRISLSSAVTVLTVHEPILVWERFATLDSLSGGRAEIAVGPGAFADVFEMFNIDFSSRRVVYDAKLAALLNIARASSPEAAAHKHRAGLIPATHREPSIRVASSGNEASLLRAAELQLPVILAIREGDPGRFAANTRLYLERFHQAAGRHPELTLHMSGFVGETLESARRAAWPYIEQVMSTVGAERRWAALTRTAFDEATLPTGSMLFGDAETVAAKIVRWMTRLGATRFALKYSVGQMPHEVLMGSIARFGRDVVPLVRAQLR